MNVKLPNASYVKSLFWVALFLTVTLGVAIIVELLIIDFIHGNPHRTQANAIQMMFIFPPLFGIINVIGVFLVFTLPQFFQAMLAGILAHRFGRRAYCGILLALPVTAVITWYCYDYFTPSDMNLAINEGPDWTPYKHGMTMQRYLGALVAQALVTIFSVLYCHTWASPRLSKKNIIRIMLILAAVAGIILGCYMAKTQFQFL